MPNSALRNGDRNLAINKLEDDRPEDLIRILVDRFGQTHGHSLQLQAEAAIEEVILDIDVYGTRYLLVRLPKPSKACVQLSPREHEIVRMVALGHPNKIIADVLSISSWTVCTHLRRIFAKLGVGSRAAMVARVRQLGVQPSGAPAQAIGRDVATSQSPTAAADRVTANTSVAQQSARRSGRAL